MTYLWHVTLNTAHARRSPRAEVDQIAVESVGVELGRALRDGATDIRLGQLTQSAPHYRLKATSAGGALVFSVFAPSGAPLVSCGVAKQSKHAVRLWEAMVDSMPSCPAHRPERTPWLAVRIEPSIALDPGAMSWLADYERIVAWAWIERQEGL